MKNLEFKLLFILLINFNSYSQLSPIKENVVYTFFNDFKLNSNLKIHKVKREINLWLPDDLNGIANEANPFYQTRPLVQFDSVTKYFTKSDIEFIEQQIPFLNKEKFWKQEEMNHITLIDSTEFNLILKKSINKKKYKNNFAYVFSKPLFSKDLNRIIIKELYFCGFQCATECIYIYEKQNNGIWKEISSWNCWSS